MSVIRFLVMLAVYVASVESAFVHGTVSDVDGLARTMITLRMRSSPAT